MHELHKRQSLAGMIAPTKDPAYAKITKKYNTPIPVQELGLSTIMQTKKVPHLTAYSQAQYKA